MPNKQDQDISIVITYRLGDGHLNIAGDFENKSIAVSMLAEAIKFIVNKPQQLFPQAKPAN